MNKKEQLKMIATISAASCVLLSMCVALLYLPVWKLHSGVSILFMIVGIFSTFFFGIVFNMLGWSALAEGLCRSQPHIAVVTVPPFLTFVLLIFLTVGTDSPLPEYMIMTASPALRQVSVCDWPTWNTSESGVYFRDTTLSRNGMDVGGVVATVSRCSRGKKGNWVSCQFGVRPIFQCESALGNCEGESPCAWAVTVDGTIPVAVPCGESNTASLCGFVASFPASSGEGNSESKAEMAAAIQEAAKALNVSYSGEAPMVRLANPTMVKDELYPFYVTWWCVAIFYTVVPAILMCLFSNEMGSSRESQSRETQFTDSDKEFPDVE
eukprot:TRINITY_DN13451_c0_g1_i1.p1 TRINITY_DN13451_c0_g1~~TRINITY_DN13451_c0_g1_i1.p1  ORF type:complete len:340 (+),score=39.27 TRINITY_DN13451_c0_g1_i1:50-1021(+)